MSQSDKQKWFLVILSCSRVYNMYIKVLGGQYEI